MQPQQLRSGALSGFGSTAAAASDARARGASFADPGHGIRVTVVEEHEILCRGLVASLAEDGRLQVTTAMIGDPIDADVAVVSPEAARRQSFPCPIVVCGDDPPDLQSVASRNEVFGLLRCDTLSQAQLRATVYATAAGLRVNAEATDGVQSALEPRFRCVLELMAAGHTTREIAARMSYSERTIKKLINVLYVRLGTRSRAQAVAEAIRQGLI